MIEAPKLPISVRAFGPDDYKHWLPLWKGYQSFYKADIADDVSQFNFARMLNPAEPMFGALATYGEQALGLVHWIFHRSNWTAGDYCYLQDLYVDTQVRARGIGRMLIEHVSTEARNARCSRVYWLTQESNISAMRLYDAVAERTGFVHYKQPL